MTGGILQLSLFGAEDLVLTSQPQITWFKTVWRRPTPFATSHVECSFQGTADFGKKASLPIPRSGDLVMDIWLQITLPSLSKYHEPLPAITATKPVIKYARFTSATSARVVVVPSLNLTGNAAQLYTATLTPVGGGSTVTATSTSGAPRTIDVTGLDASKEYDAVVEAVGQAGDDPSQSTEVIALKWCNSIGHAIMVECECEIGGAKIDRHTSDFLDIWSELTTPEEKQAGFYEMIGKYADYDPRSDTQSFDDERTLFVPLQFFFCNHAGMALPIVALTYHETKINFQFREYRECLRSTRRAVSMLVDDAGYPLAVQDFKAYANFVYLDVMERRKYSSIPHEYLVQLTQFLGDAAVNVQAGDTLVRKFPLDFSHPVKELLWVYNDYETYTGNSMQVDWFNYGDHDFFEELLIQINGHDRFSKRPPGYFRLCQTYAHHTRVPNKRIYCYSFSLFPESHSASSGTLNWSRVDTAHMVATLKPGQQGRIRCYATSYNVLRISGGLGGLSFAG